MNQSEIDRLEDLGYAYYGGNDTTSCDWYKARDIFLQLMDIVEDEDKKGQYANTLGYIYYYGRCNGGIPQYEEAYKYFSIGAEAGFYESRYKIADMYMNGYYVEKDERKATYIYIKLYEENEKYFRLGYAWDSKYPDIALRLAGLYRNGIGCDVDEKAALFILTLADYAIKRRIERYDFYGDSKVAKSISSQLKELQEKYEVDLTVKKIWNRYPMVEPATIADQNVAFIRFERKGQDMVIHCRRFSESKQDLPIAIIDSQSGYVNFETEPEEIARNVTEFRTFKESIYEIWCDEIKVNEDGIIQYLLMGNLLAVLKADHFEYELKRE